jgi:ATP-dependent Clp protease ATP-binding subunit ClpX
MGVEGKDLIAPEKPFVKLTPEQTDEFTRITQHLLIKHSSEYREYRETLARKISCPFKNPKEIKEKLDKTVAGQVDAKRILSVAVWNHILRVNAMEKHRVENPTKPPLELQKTNVLLVGPTGSGKTYMVSQLTKLFEIPFFCADATQITQVGFVGKDADYCLEGLFLASGKDLAKTERGIILIDEVDKIATSGDNKNGEMKMAAQQSMLKMIEGTKMVVQIHEQGSKTAVTIDTANIMFIFCGAFNGIDEDNSRMRMGFHADLSPVVEKTKISPQDIVKFGFIPEFIGRISLVARLNKLTKVELVSILKDVDNSVIDQYKSILELNDMQLTVTPDAYDAIAESADSLGIGARSLRNIVDRIMVVKQYDNEEPNIIITSDDVASI